MEFSFAKRLDAIPPYLFAELEREVADKLRSGRNVINLAIGDTDLPTPLFIREAIAKGALDERNHNYSSSAGEPQFINSVILWYQKRFGVEVCEENVCSLIGSKEGIANVARAFVNPGDKVLVPNPGYAVFRNGATLLCDGRHVDVPLLEENGFLPALDELSEKEVRGTKMLYLNYPNNPTGAVADEKFLRKAVDFCLERGIVLCYDNAYSEFTFDQFVAPSILQVSGAMDCTIEFCSLSKTFCMTGDRCGFAVGNPRVIAGLRKVKSNIDSGLSVYLQKAACAALDSYSSKDRPPEVEAVMREYERRRNALVAAINDIGLACSKPPATFYVWVKVGGSSIEFCRKALACDVVITPGVGFGTRGEGFVRFAVTQKSERLVEAVSRVGETVKELNDRSSGSLATDINY